MEVFAVLTVIGSITQSDCCTPVRALDTSQTSWVWAACCRVHTWVSFVIDVERFTARPVVAASFSTVIDVVRCEHIVTEIVRIRGGSCQILVDQGPSSWGLCTICDFADGSTCLEPHVTVYRTIDINTSRLYCTCTGCAKGVSL